VFLNIADEQFVKPIIGMKEPKLGIISTMNSPSSDTPAALASSSRMSLADALFSVTQQRVLGWIFGQPERDFYANELMVLTMGGSGAVQRELARLEQSELVTVRMHGRQKHYQANPDSPIFVELCGIVQKTVGLVVPLRQALAPLAHTIEAAFVFGSVAKKQDTASSDIDLMIISEVLSYADLFSVTEQVSARLSRRVNPTIYTKEEWQLRRQRGDAFVKRVVAQPKLWVIGDAGAIGL
jgi:predicted nucleotidyltransferase